MVMLLNLWLPAKDQVLKISAWKGMGPWDTTTLGKLLELMEAEWENNSLLRMWLLVGAHAPKNGYTQIHMKSNYCTHEVAGNILFKENLKLSGRWDDWH